MNLFKNKILRSIMIVIGIIGILIIAVLLTLRCSPQFGGTISVKGKKEYSNSTNFKDGKFINRNEVDVAVKITFAGFIKNLPLLFESKDTTTIPSADLPKEDIKLSYLNIKNGETRLFWFGHSSILLQIEDKNILFDPVFSQRASPFSWTGPKRFSSSLPITVNKLPEIDAVIISHDHYDHLDYNTINEIKDKVKMFYTPLGVGVHLKRWGIETKRIVELDWWQEVNTEGLKLIATPSLHTSGRKPNTTASTLWSSWIIKSKKQSIFFSGDGGYDNHFKEIGDKYGPFDFALMECGQYNAMWPKLHMFPEQTVQAGVDIKAKQIMPIHWGAFSISTHPWTEPVERVIRAGEKINLPVIVPKIGEPIIIQDPVKYSDETWWNNN